MFKAIDFFCHQEYPTNFELELIRHCMTKSQGSNTHLASFHLHKESSGQLYARLVARILRGRRTLPQNRVPPEAEPPTVGLACHPVKVS